jgi:biopolymer transport protein ExbD
MSRKGNHSDHPEEFDLLPFANFFMLLVPFLLSLAVWQKFAVIEIKLGEASMADAAEAVPQETEDMDLNLTVFVASDSMEIQINTGSDDRGAAFPKIYFNEYAIYRCKDDKSSDTILMRQFRELTPDGPKVLAKCIDNPAKTAALTDIEDVITYAVRQDPKTGALLQDPVYVVREGGTSQPVFLKDSKDPETFFELFVSDLTQIKPGQAYLLPMVGDLGIADTSSRFEITAVVDGQRTVIPKEGEAPAPAIKDAERRQKHERELKDFKVERMTAYDLLAQQLAYVRNKVNASTAAGVDCSWGPGTEGEVVDPSCTQAKKLYISADFRISFDRLSKVMDVARNVGFDQIEFGAVAQ